MLEIHQRQPPTYIINTNHGSNDSPSGPFIQNELLYKKNEITYSINGVAKSFFNRDKYSGSSDEDLRGKIEVYEAACTMYKLDVHEMRRGIIFVLSGLGLSYYILHL